MIVNKLKIITLDKTDYTIEKGKIFFDGIVEKITINRESGNIIIKFENSSDWEETTFILSNLESYTYAGKHPLELPVH